MAQTSRGFLLTRNARDTRNGIEFDFWLMTEGGPAHIRITEQEAVFFVERATPEISNARRAERDLVTLAGAPVDAMYFRSSSDLRQARELLATRGVRLYESDVKSVDRFLMERFIRGGIEVDGIPEPRAGYREFLNPTLRAAAYTPRFRVLSMDIETEGLTGALYSIAAASNDESRVFMVSGRSTPEFEGFPDETSLLRAFFAWLNDVDPDIIVGWNVVDFDLSFLEKRCDELGVPFALGRGGGTARILAPATARQTRIVKCPGRVVLDGIALLRTATWSFEYFSLEYVAQQLLGRGKLIHPVSSRVDEINRLYREDKAALARYNLEDCKLVLDVFKAAGLLDFAVERAQITGLPLDRQGGSVAAFDFRYLPLLHRRGVVARDVGSVNESVMSPGGYVMDSIPGLYENVLVLDFKSLYPSIIRTFMIDPLGMAFSGETSPGEDSVPGFRGARFSRSRSILPDLIAELGAAREEAKLRKNKPLSQAIKIMMNSFYGVLGTPGCRFFDPALASSVTLRGHEIIHRTRASIEQRGYRVIYGDTDSLFVHIGVNRNENGCRQIGAELANAVNTWWAENLRAELRLESHLEIEFEKHYLQFFMPTIRGTETGSKKRYAGFARNDQGELAPEFTGLEAVRTDWTPLAREVQRELFRRIFVREPYEAYLRTIAQEVLDGCHDDRLVYRKRLRRPLDEYTKNVPPHVRAARKSGSKSRWISYVITVNGPEPAEASNSALDYAHYLERQLAPAADGILRLFDTSFAKITENQLELFERTQWKSVQHTLRPIH